MKEISRAKKLEVAQYYFLGYSYEEIASKSNVSKGSVVNIIKELGDGKLAVPGIPFDRVNDLRELSSDLKKKGFEPSQALLGVQYFERLTNSGVAPEDIDRWLEFMRTFCPPDLPAREFFEAAFRLKELERSAGTPYQTLAEEYERLNEEIAELEVVVASLDEKRIRLSQEIDSMSSQVESLKGIRKKSEADAEIESARVQYLKSCTKDTKEEKSRLNKEMKELRNRKGKLCLEIDGKDEVLERLNNLGFSDEDLLRFRSILEKMSRIAGTSPAQIKEMFFSSLGLIGDISGFEKKRDAEVAAIKKLNHQSSVLVSEIAQLENQKGVLQGEINRAASAAMEVIRNSGEEGVSQIQQQIDNITSQFKSLFEDAIRTGRAVGDMMAMKKKGEESAKSVEVFIEDLRSRLEGK